MNNYLKALILSVGVFFCSNGGQCEESSNIVKKNEQNVICYSESFFISSQKKSDIENKPIEKLIETELNKYDSWIENFVVHQSLPKYNKNPIAIQTLSIQDEANLLAMFICYYGGSDKVIALPRRDEIENNYEKKQGAIVAIHHELWHAIYHQLDKGGFFSSDKYTGPSKKEISEFVSSNINKEGFKSFFDNIKKNQISKNNLLKIMKIREEYLRLTILMLEFEKYEEKLVETYSFDNKNQINAKSAIDDIIQKSYSDVFLKYTNSFNVYGVNKDRAKFAKSILKLNLDEKNLEKETSDLFIKYISLTKSLESILKDETIEKDINKDIFSTHMRYVEVLANAKLPDSVFSTQTTFEYLSDDDEFMARMINSLYSLYVNKYANESFYPLEDNNAQEFLGKFVYDGKKMFGKQLEKYKLIYPLIRDGFKKGDSDLLIKAKKVWHDLGYATSFEYKGKKYDWSESNVKMKSKFPIHNDDPAFNKLIESYMK